MPSTVRPRSWRKCTRQFSRAPGMTMQREAVGHHVSQFHELAARGSGVEVQAIADAAQAVVRMLDQAQLGARRVVRQVAAMPSRASPTVAELSAIMAAGPVPRCPAPGPVAG